MLADGWAAAAASAREAASRRETRRGGRLRAARQAIWSLTVMTSQAAQLAGPCKLRRWRALDPRSPVVCARQGAAMNRTDGGKSTRAPNVGPMSHRCCAGAARTCARLAAGYPQIATTTFTTACRQTAVYLLRN